MPGAPPDLVVAVALQFLVLIGVSAAFSLLLVRAGVPGGRPASAVVGGIVAGVVLGPMVFGRVAPGAQELLFLGGTAQRAALHQAQREGARARAALEATGVTPQAVREFDAQTRARIDRAAEDVDRATRRYRDASLVICAVLLAGAAGGAAAAVPAVRPHGADWLAGAFAFGFGALPVAVVLRWLWSIQPEHAIVLAAPAGALSLGGAGLRPGVVPGLTAGALCASVPVALAQPIVVPLAAGVAASAGIGALIGRVRARPCRLRSVFHFAVAPAVALAVARIDPVPLASDARSLVLVLLAVVFAGGGQVLGVWAALKTFGRPAAGWNALRFLPGTGCAVALAASPLPLLETADVVHLPTRAALAAAIAAALTVECTAPLVIRLAGALGPDGA